ncbi:MAG TPA: dienelactone hydrolase family protein [Hyphomonadaceae bacterium]|jgi:carboxymethylenebutenolidase|nr:dienelactone hydrolase family protein [Hyphomonadaceae bacterium]
MCDEHTEHDNEDGFDTGRLSRRGFGVMSMAALAACTTSPENPATIVEREVEITTPDGVIDAHYAAPSSGKHPAVLVWPDIMGLRPAFRLMGKRLAESGYAVLTVNPFYRLAKGQVFDATTEKFSDAPVRTRLVALMGPTVGNPENTRKDAVAAVAWLDKQKEVDTSKGIGTTGYCMGGPLVMRTMAFVPGRVKAGGSFHGGGLAVTAATATEAQRTNSPHLLVPQMQAKAVLIAVAQNDDKQDPTVKETVKAAFDAKKIPAEVEVYAADHGWCPPDSQVFNQAEADRAWSRLLATFKAGL